MGHIEKKEIIAQLKQITEIKKRFSFIIELGRNAPNLLEEEKIEENRIKGCNSFLWIVSSLQEGKVYFKVDSDASIPKGLGTILTKVYSGLSPQEILDNNIDFLSEVGIEQHLSMNRRSGLANILKQINYYAVAYSAIVN